MSTETTPDIFERKPTDNKILDFFAGLQSERKQNVDSACARYNFDFYSGQPSEKASIDELKSPKPLVSPVLISKNILNSFSSLRGCNNIDKISLYCHEKIDLAESDSAVNLEIRPRAYTEPVSKFVWAQLERHPDD